MVSSGDQKDGVATIIKHNYSTPIFLCCNESFDVDAEIAREEIEDAKENIQNSRLATC